VWHEKGILKAVMLAIKFIYSEVPVLFSFSTYWPAVLLTAREQMV
jgi:hypothetical protein